MSVNPKVIQTPPVMAMAQDGIQVRATCRITVKANIEKLVGGAGEDTILARVGEGVVTTIGSQPTTRRSWEPQPDLPDGAGQGKPTLGRPSDPLDRHRRCRRRPNIGAQLRIDQAEAETDRPGPRRAAAGRRRPAKEMRPRWREPGQGGQARPGFPGLATALRTGRLRSA